MQYYESFYAYIKQFSELVRIFFDDAMIESIDISEVDVLNNICM